VFLEFPAGKLDAGESALATAQRELTEETGYIAARWTRLGLIHPTVSYSTEAIEIFVAGDLTHVGRKLDDGEFLDIAEMTSDALLAALDDGELTDAKTVAALLMYLRKDQNRSAPPCMLDTVSIRWCPWFSLRVPAQPVPPLSLQLVPKHVGVQVLAFVAKPEQLPE